MTTTRPRQAARRAAPAGLLALGAALLAPAAPAPAAAATLIRSCPTTIIAPGTYVLARDLTCPGDGPAIEVAADDVRLDLGGRTLTGDGGPGDGVLAEGTEANPALTGLRITNGTVTGFDDGLQVRNAPGARIAGVNARDNEDFGLFVEDSPGARVTGGTASGNGFVGILVFDSPRSQVAGNTASRNGVYGIPADGCDGCEIAGNRADGNVLGIALFDSRGARVAGNRADGNEGVGILALEGSTGNRLEGNRATGNGAVDLVDESLPADPPGACPNTWRGNRFATDSEGDGPGAGCIR